MDVQPPIDFLRGIYRIGILGKKMVVGGEEMVGIGSMAWEKIKG